MKANIYTNYKNNDITYTTFSQVMLQTADDWEHVALL